METSETSSTVWTGVTLAVAVGSVAALVPLLRSGMDPQRLTPVLAFLGILLTAAITVLGLILKRVAERRIEAGQHSERERLRLEAAMRAGSLLAAEEGKTPNPATMASGLLALSSLGQSELAVAPLVDLWSASDADVSPSSDLNRTVVSTETAILAIDAALRSGEVNAPLVAAELLCRNAHRLDACQSLHWPSSLDGRWLPNAGQKTKLLLLDALITMTTTSPPDENALRSLAVRLYGIWQGDPSMGVKGCVANLINVIVAHLETCSYKEFIEGPRVVTLAQLQAAAATRKTKSDHFLAVVMQERCDRLDAWSKQCHTTFAFRCGALGDGTPDSTRSTPALASTGAPRAR
jgi:hypothetical protein